LQAKVSVDRATEFARHIFSYGAAVPAELEVLADTAHNKQLNRMKAVQKQYEATADKIGEQ
jgi:hypothetical protein